MKIELTEAEFFAIWEHVKGSPLRGWLEAAAPAAPPKVTYAPVEIKSSVKAESPLTEADKQALDALAGMGIRPVADYPPPSDILKKHFDSLGKLTPEQESAALETFATFIDEWLVGWEIEGATQPDRVRLMEHLGSGAHARHILILAFQRLSLQALIIDAIALKSEPFADSWKEGLRAASENLDRIDRIAGHLVQLAAPCGFPELVDTFDYTTRWRRTT